MSEFSISSRRFKNKKKYKKTSFRSSSSKDRKRKSCLSSEYQETEREVQFLMENSSITFDISSNEAIDNQSLSINFFCGTSELDTGRTTIKSERNSTILDHLNYRFQILEEENEDEDDEIRTGASQSILEGMTNKIVESTSKQETQQSTVSSFLQIAIENIVTSEKLLYEEFMLNSSLLFYPTKSLNYSLTLGLDNYGRSLDSFVIKMLNRFNEQWRVLDQKPPPHITRGLQNLCHSKDFFKGFKIYRSFYQYEFHPIFCLPSKETAEIPSRKFIKLFLKELHFTKHPLINEEHKLANKLEMLYADYFHRIREGKNEKLYNMLQTERKIVSDLLDHGEALFGADRENHVFNLERHSSNVKALRNKLYDLEEENKSLLKEILEVWMKLKDQRKAQGTQYTKTKLNLHIKDPICTMPDELEKWNERFEIDLNEIYREELEVFYNSQRLRKERNRNASYSHEKLQKPEYAHISKQLKRKFQKCFFSPDEPRVFLIKNNLTSSEFYSLNNRSLGKLKSYFLKIYFDSQYVGSTRCYRMEPDLCLYINEAIGVFVERRLPKNVKVKLYEKTKVPKPRKIAVIHIPLSKKGVTFDNQTHRFAFVGQKPVYLEGNLHLKFDCDYESYDHEQIPSNEKQRSNLSGATDWIEETSVGAENLSETEDELDTEGETLGDNFGTVSCTNTCTFEENFLEFCPRENIEYNCRLRLLRSRYLKNDVRTKDLRFIPALDNEIDFNWDENEDNVLDIGNWMHPIDLHKYKGKKYLKNLYEAIEMQCSSLNKIHESSDNLLVGDEPASLRSFLNALASIFHSPKRSLNPVRSAITSTSTSNLTLDRRQTFKILLNLVRATGIPVRSEQTTLLDQDNSSKRESSGSTAMFMSQNLKYSNVRPFITMTYRDKIVRSMTAEGSNPTWNENLILELSGSLTDFRDDIKILLFDEVIEQQWNDDCSVRNMDLLQRFQANYIGEYRIPIQNLFRMKKMDGVFELNVPKVLVGYTKPFLENIITTESNYPQIKESVYIWLYISMEPTFELPTIRTRCLECAELKDVRLTLEDWCILVREQHPLRFIEPLVGTMDGKLVCLTRLLEPLSTPIKMSENLLDSAIRYVSLFNTLKHYDPCSDLNGIWLDNKVIMDTTWASEKDLAVLLCNFILGIGLTAYLVLGVANNHGQCVFVLFKTEKREVFLIDPITAKRYPLRDTFCPLQKVNMIVNKDNIYCNIQSEKRSSMTNFNINDSNCWLPAFGKRKTAPLGGIQKINYLYDDSLDHYEIIKNIERKIIKKVNSWRPTRKTIWNRAFQPRLFSILQNLEELVTFEKHASIDYQLADRLTLEWPKHKIYGFTLNFSYTNLSSISERIRATGIHLNSDKNVEFSLAVHVVPYPNNIYSIWIFLISAIRQ